MQLCLTHNERVAYSCDVQLANVHCILINAHLSDFFFYPSSQPQLHDGTGIDEVPGKENEKSKSSESLQSDPGHNKEQIILCSLEEGEITLVQAEGSTAEVTTPTTCVKEGEDQAGDVRTSPVHYAGEVQGDHEATRTLSEKESLPTGRGNESTSPTAHLGIPGMCVAVEGSVLSGERQCVSHEWACLP